MKSADASILSDALTVVLIPAVPPTAPDCLADALVVRSQCRCRSRSVNVTKIPTTECPTPHYNGHPTVLVHLAAVDVEELRGLITESWPLKAPKRVLQAFEDEPTDD
jgi:hypothetical protein